MSKHEQSRFLMILAEAPTLVSPSFATLNLKEKELHKHTMIEKLPFHLTDSGMKEATSLLIAYFNPKTNQSTIYTVPLETLAIAAE
jgi:anaerobic magnesium-protoporphyrin IX monomethyl ester cyclase